MATAHGGTVTLLANGSFTFTPAANFNGADTFTYSYDLAGNNSPNLVVNFTKP